jgi:hypothetical protein
MLADMSSRVRRLLRRREQEAVEPLYENEALRDNLDDEQAQLVLQWGEAQIAELARLSAELTDEEATAVLASRADAVRQALVWLNTAVGQANPEDIPLEKLWSALSHLIALPADPPPSFATWWQETQQLPTPERFARLHDFLQHPADWVS